jgi:hypothetical protein
MVPSVTLLEVTEVIPCTKEAEQILSGIKEWVKE